MFIKRGDAGKILTIIDPDQVEEDLKEKAKKLSTKDQEVKKEKVQK